MVAVGMAQAGLDHFAGTAKQLRPHRFVGQERRQKGTRDLFLGERRSACKAAVGGVDRLAVADQQAFDGGVGEAAHAVGFLLQPTAVANVEGKAAAGEQQDRQAGERDRDGEPAGRDGGLGHHDPRVGHDRGRAHRGEMVAANGRGEQQRTVEPSTCGSPSIRPTLVAAAPISAPAAIDTMTRTGSQMMRPWISKAAMPV